MTEFPALRESLVRAAARRRRRRLTLGAAVPGLAVAAAAIALFVLPGGGVPDQEREAVTPSPSLSPLAQAFAVFRKPQAEADKLPRRDVLGGTFDPASSRLLARGGGAYVYAVPVTLRGQEQLCLVDVRVAHAGAGCVPFSTAFEQGAGVSGGGVYVQLFPDGASDVRLTLQDGTRLFPKLQNGAVFAEADRVGVAAWTSRAGVRYFNRNEWAPQSVDLPERCPKALDPLPADPKPKAARIALRAAEDLYRGAQSAEVAQILAGPQRGTPCGPAVTGRTLEVDLELKTPVSSDSLAQGRLLVGNVNGQLQVFYRMH